MEIQGRKMVKKLILYVIITYSSFSYANEVRFDSSLILITEQENAELRKINNKYNYDEQLNKLNNEMSLHSARVWKYKNTIDELNELKKYLSESVISINSISEKNKIDDLVNSINKKNNIEKNLSTYDNLESNYKTLKDKYNNLSKVNKQFNIDKRNLLTKIIERIKNDINNNNTSGKYYGSVSCNTNNSIIDCLERNQFDIKNRIIDKSKFLTKDSVFSQYEVSSANLNLDGSLSFNITFRASPIFSKKVYKLLNEKLGFDLVKVSLKSNVPAEWYINGKLFGEGELVEAEIPAGSHGIYATYKGKAKSSVEEIYKPIELRYIIDK